MKYIFNICESTCNVKVYVAGQALMPDSFEAFWNVEYREKLLREGIRQIVDVTIKDYEPRFPEIGINRCKDKEL